MLIVSTELVDAAVVFQDLWYTDKGSHLSQVTTILSVLGGLGQERFG